MGKATVAQGDALARIFREGVLVDLTVGIPGADRRVDAEAAGVDHDPAAKKLVKATARLWDPETFAAERSIKAQAERVVERVSIPGMIYGARFVPAGEVGALAAALGALRDQFVEARDETTKPGGRYDQRRAAVLAEYNGGPLRDEVERRCPTAAQVWGMLSFEFSFFAMASLEAERERLVAQAVRWAEERVAGLYAAVVEACEHVLALAASGKPLRAQSVDALRRAVSEAGRKNVFGAAGLGDLVRRVELLAGGGAAEGEWHSAGAPDVDTAGLRAAVEAARAEVAAGAAEAAVSGWLGRRLTKEV